MTSSSQDDSRNQLVTLPLTVPWWMLEELRARARRRGVTVTELIRRSVGLDQMLFSNPEIDVVLRRRPDVRSQGACENLVATLEELGASDEVIAAARRGSPTPSSTGKHS